MENFNPRSRVGNDQLQRPLTTAEGHFNPRSRVGNDDRATIDANLNADFNPRSRVGNDRILSYNVETSNKFQSTFPRGERLDRLFFIPCQKVFQSTFPRGERLRMVLLSWLMRVNFNPRSRVGNDYNRSIFSSFQINFNPRSRVGNDRKSLSCILTTTCISIHVPAWGTTEMAIAMESLDIFQSTFPRGERLR